MSGSKKASSLAIAALLGSVLSAPLSARAEGVVEKTGVGIGVTAGNMIFVPSKAISLVSAVTASAISFLVTGGSVEVARQIWENTLEGPYAITPPVARAAIGERPGPDRK